MATESELKSKIKNAQGDISKLKEEKKKYEKLKEQLENNTVPKLKDSKSKINDAKKSLKANLQSQASKKKEKEITKTVEDIGTIMTNIKDKIIPAIKEKIKEIDQKISSKNNSIGSLTIELNNLEKEEKTIV